SVPYQLINTGTTPVSLASITFNSEKGQQHLEAGVPAGKTVSGKFDLAKARGYYIVGAGFDVPPTGGVDCGTLNIAPVNGKWPANSTLVITLKNSQDPKHFSCTFTKK